MKNKNQEKRNRIALSGLFLLGITLSIGASIDNYFAAFAIGLCLAVAINVNHKNNPNNKV